MNPGATIRRALTPVGRQIAQDDDAQRRAEIALAATTAAAGVTQQPLAATTAAVAELVVPRAQPDDDKKDDDKKDDDKKTESDKKDDDDEDSDDEKGDKAAVRSRRIGASREAERGRITAILSSEAGQANPRAAMAIALGGGMPRNEAIATLCAIGPALAASRDTLAERMARTEAPHAGPSMPNGGTSGGGTTWSAQAIVAAAARARGEGVKK